MAQNTGTLITASIRPNDSLDPIASAFSSEIKGGLHTTENISERDQIIEERRDWGMLCYVKNENTTYQLIFGKVNTDINDNNNWEEFSGSGSGDNNSQWLDSVLSVITSPPSNPQVGDRYLGGYGNGDSLSGIWSVKLTGLIFEWDSEKWVETEPKNADSIRINDEKNVVYRYDGDYPNGSWYKESINQVIEINATSQDGISYTSTTEFKYGEYLKNTILLTNFDSDNENTQATININSIGSVDIKKPTDTGLSNLTPGDIMSGVIYTLLYDGEFFQLVKHYTNDSLEIKNKIEVNDYIVIPENHQYWIYGDLEIEGKLINYGEIVISNGSTIITGNGEIVNNGDIKLISLLNSDNFLFSNTDTIGVTLEQNLFGMSYSFNVVDNSIEPIKLDTGTQSVTEGYFLTNENNKFKWVTMPEQGITSLETIYETDTPLSTSGNNQYTGINITNTPSAISNVEVYLNGQMQILGSGDLTKQFYFSDDSGISSLTFDNIKADDELYFNGDVSGYNLSNTDTILIIYKI